MKEQREEKGSAVLVLGATGFVGSRLVPELVKRGIRLKILVRDTAKAAALFPDAEEIEICQGDLLTGKGLSEALRGVAAAYYLVHSMGGRSILRNDEFAQRDLAAARNFIASADEGGLGRIIYLGGLGEAGDDLSEHLKSRAHIASVLSSGKAAATILRAAVIIGAGGASFEMLRYLVERLPVMVCPRWIDTRIQPIAINDVLGYLVGCLMNEQTAGQTFDIGGPDILSYRKMMHGYAAARGLRKRIIITVPVLTPLLSAYWVDLVTPIPSGVAHPLIEGMKNEVVCKDNRIDQFVRIVKTPYQDAVRMAVAEEGSGPGRKRMNS